MRSKASRRWLVAGLATLLAAGLLAAATSGGAAASAANGTYLALGDSVAFGYVPAQAVPPPNYLDPHSFVGYPEFLAKRLNEHVANASCPGETTGSMLSTSAQSNGCENSVGSPVGYRTFFPLHVGYQGSQEAYAIHYLTTHKHTNLVTIDIGANDAFVCQETTSDHCSSPAELSALAAQIQANLSSIYRQLRNIADYKGRLVALTYYSLDYSDPAQVASTQFLDSIIAGVTLAFGGTVADGFGAFQTASASAGGSPCAAGLLIELPDNTCDVHPTARGHRILAAAIAAAIGA